MLDPYKMILINIILSTLLGTGIIIFKVIFNKKKLNIFLVLILISLLPLISILRKGTYESGDLTIQTIGITSIYNSLKDGNIIPRWNGEAFYGYGSPQHLMMYFISRYIPALLHFSGISMLTSVKIFLGLYYVASGITMYLFVKSELLSLIKKKTKQSITHITYGSFIAALLYLFAPYHLVDLHFRVELGELVCYILLPILFLFARKIVEEKNIIYVIFEAVFIALLVLSHQAIAIFVLPFVFIYFLHCTFQSNYKLKTILLFLTSFIFSVLLSMFYWAPVLFEASKYTGVQSFSGIEFRSFWEYIYSPWRYGLLFQGPEGQLSFLLGYVHWLFILLTIFFLYKKRFFKYERGRLIILLVSFFVLFFLMQKISYPLWEIIPLIKYSQNSYRLLLLLNFFSAVIGGFLVYYIRSKTLLIIVCIFIILSTSLNWGNRKTIPEITDNSYFQKQTYEYLTHQGGIDFSLPIWADPKKLKIGIPPKSPTEILSGNAEYMALHRTTTTREYLISAKSKVTVKENTLYFPGWTLYVNNKIYPFTYTYKKYPGVIVYSLPKGLYKVQFVFQNTLIRNIGDTISIITALILISTLGIITTKQIFTYYCSKA